MALRSTPSKASKGSTVQKWKQILWTIQFKILRHYHKKLEAEIRSLKEQGQIGTPFYRKRSDLERRLREAKNLLRDQLKDQGIIPK